MFSQPTALQSALWLALKIGLGLAVFGAWWWFVFHRLIPWSSVRNRTPEHIAKFPKRTLLGLCVLTFSAGWFCSWELAYRDAQGIQAERRKVDEHEPRPIRAGTSETLEQRSERMRAEADASRAKTKEHYAEIPARP